MIHPFYLVNEPTNSISVAENLIKNNANFHLINSSSVSPPVSASVVNPVKRICWKDESNDFHRISKNDMDMFHSMNPLLSKKKAENNNKKTVIN